MITIDNVKMLVQSGTGYTVPASDDGLLIYLLQAEQRAVLDDCNLSMLPEELTTVVEERAAGKYLGLKKADIIGDDDLSTVTRIDEGDTTVQFGGTSAESRLDGLINSLLRERDLSCYRKLRW